MAEAIDDLCERRMSSPHPQGAQSLSQLVHSEVQWRDCVEIAATRPLELEYMRMWVDRLGVADDLEDLLDRS